MFKKLFPALLLVVLAVCSAPVWGQDVAAAITGIITDPSGAVVPGVSVTLENPSTGAKYTTETNKDGSYTLREIKPGPGYRLTFSLQGFEPTVVSGIYMNVDTTRTQNARLVVGSTSTSVEVSASADTVTLNTTDATVGNNFQVQFLNDLPVEDRSNPSALFYQQPGVTLDGAVTGARTDQSNVTLDGLEVNDNATGQFGAIVGSAPVDSVQEFRGVTAGETSGEGEGGGGQFNLVTKSGSNDFHGALVEYHRDTDLEANDWFNNNNGVGRPPLIRNQFGGNVGGPIKRDKAFFFFDWNSRRDTLSNLVERTVPLGTNTTGYRGGEVSYCNNQSTAQSCVMSTLTPTQVASLDPQGIGWNQAELSLFQQRYPQANDMTGAVGDLINTAGFRFNAPFPYVLNDYVSRVDVNLNDKMKMFGRGTVARQNSTQSAIQFPGDPATYPFYDKSYAWVVGHTWTINARMLNQAEYGETYEDYSFNAVYNPQGANQFGFAGLSGPYASGSNSQDRTYPIPVIRDDFSWEKGKHSFTFGGTFKWETPNEFAAENFNFPAIGTTGNTYFTGLSPNLRPADISSDWITPYDTAFSTALGVVADVSSNFNYNNKGQVQAQGSGLDLNYRYYETELYFGDSWKITPNFTVTYGVRYQNYTVPYETRGEEAITNLVQDGTTSTFSWDTYWKDRETQSAAGNTALDAIPFLQFLYGGKVNHQPSYFQPNNKDFSPRLAFAFNPGLDKRTVFRGGIGIVYDHSLINALQFQQLQTSYVFEANNTNLFGTPGDPTATMETAPRFAGISSPPPAPQAPAISTPFVPFVYQGFPYGLPYGEFNLMMNTTLKTPYNIQLDFGFQHEFPQRYILKVDYVGRLGRRLLATADSSQLLDFPDASGGSSQTMAGAMSGLVTQLRQNANLGALGAILAVTPEPWFEDMLPGLNAYESGQIGYPFSSATQAIAYAFYPYPQRGDFADLMQAISTTGYLPANVGMASQFSSNSVWTNKGSSNYNGMLVTLHKNAGYGLQFDLNYTWAHSIDNVSAIANFIAASSGYGWICDVQRPRECRANSTFDIANEINGNFIYELPFGRGRNFGATIPYWANELVGGWEISGLPSWRTGQAYNMYANAYITSFANDAPATLVGSPALLHADVQHQGKGNPVNAFSNPTAALGAYTGPTGFDIGQRDNLRGPGYFDIDLGLGKTFPIYREGVDLKFRCDAFNATNHPSFNTPSANDITQANGVPFGTVTSTYSTPRVLQLALRVEF